MVGTLTALHAVFCLWFDIVAVLLQSRVQVQKFIHREVVFVVDLRACVVVDILACRGIVAADKIANVASFTLAVPSPRLAVVGS